MMPAAGRQTGWVRPSAPRRVTAFDLATEIPLRARLFRVGDDEHVLVARGAPYRRRRLVDDPAGAGSGGGLCQPVCGAGPGLGAVGGAVCRLHAVAARAAGDLADSDSPIAAQLAYWEQALAGMPERWCCPPIGPIRRWPITAAPVWPWTGRRELQQRVARVAREHNATSFMVMQAALAVLLSSSAPAPMWPSGSRSLGAATPALDELVGFFVNTLVLRVDWPGIPPSPSCWPRCERAAWPPTSTKTCPLRCWSIGSTPPEA